MDLLMLSRLQFALTIMFHYLFPPLTIGLGVVLVYLEGMNLVTKDRRYDAAGKFWTRIFGLNFAMGVVTGIVMEFQFGTNWAAYSRFVGDVFGSALAAEGIFAFFLESGFLSILLFGWDRVGPKTHFFATLMVAVGGIFSSIWIVIANSWQQTPAGSVLRDHVVNGHASRRAEIVDFWALVFNPSSVTRLIHVWLGAFLLGAFFVMSVSAWYLLKDRHVDFARRSFRGALILATISSVAQFVSGDSNAKMVGRHQPAKMAAMEGVFKTGPGAPLYMMGLPDEKAGVVRFGVGIPGMLSWLLHGDVKAEVAGLDRLEKDYGRPPVGVVFQAYHVMVGIGMMFLGSTLLASFLLWRGTLFSKRWFLRYFVVAVIPAFVANETGWMTAEVGRQPWVVYPTVVDGRVSGGLRTADGLSEAVRKEQVVGSIVMFGLIYALLFVLWLVLLNNKIQHGPDPAHPASDEPGEGLLDAASGRVDHRGSLTEAKAGDPATTPEGEGESWT